MTANDKVVRVRFYVSSTDKEGTLPVYESITLAAKRMGVAGCTVYRGIMGYGASSELRSDKFWELTEKLPVVVEIVDEEEKIEPLLQAIQPRLEALPKGCLITKERVDVLLVKQGNKK